MTSYNNSLLDKMKAARDQSVKKDNERKEASLKNLEKYICGLTSDKGKLEKKLIQAAAKYEESVKLCDLHVKSWWHGWDSLEGLEQIVDNINKNLNGIYIKTAVRRVWVRNDYYNQKVYEDIRCIKLYAKNCKQ